MEVRRFKLINSENETYDFMLKSHFLHSPSGLGFNRKDTFLNLGDNFVRVNQKSNQAAPSGKIAFIDDGNYDIYEQYHDFALFISKEPLKLKYSPYGIEYTMDVVVKKLSKSEINQQGYLDCDIEFGSLTPWYKMVTIDYSDGAGLVPREDLYPSGSLTPRSPTQSIVVDYHNEGTLMAKSKLKIYGPTPANDPYFRWGFGEGSGDKTGEVYCGANGLNSNQVLIIDCISIPYKIYRTSRANVNTTDPSKQVDMYDKSNFETERFVTFNPGTDNVFILDNPSSIVGYPTRIVLEIMECYETV